jgi:hypothetical protein
VGALAVVGLLFAVGSCGAPGVPMSARGGPIAAPAPVPTVAPRICPPGVTPVHVSITGLSQIAVNVYNGTSRASLATTVATELRNRGLSVHSVGSASGGPHPQTVLRFGPDGVGAAWYLRAYFPGAQSEFDASRPGAPVDVIVGASFVNVPTKTEVNQAIAQLGQPVPPPGTCPVD